MTKVILIILNCGCDIVTIGDISIILNYFVGYYNLMDMYYYFVLVVLPITMLSKQMSIL